MRAGPRFPGCVALGAEFSDKDASATCWILRLSCTDAYCKCSEKPYGQLHPSDFRKSGVPEGILIPQI